MSEGVGSPLVSDRVAARGARAEKLEVRLAGTELAIVQDINFEVGAGELLGIVGESGSGKTTVALALLGFAKRGAAITGGTVNVAGQSILGLRQEELAEARGRLVSYVPQNPATALNPSMRVGQCVQMVLRAHNLQADSGVVDGLFDRLALPTGKVFRRRFPHQLSGGQQQRVVIAMALACRPSLIVLDEPTTALDVITQARILKLVGELRHTEEAAFVYVTHDLGVISSIADRVAVMYGGRIVEIGDLETIFLRPRHPYTQGLVASIATLQPGTTPLGIPGIAASPIDPPPGCSFAPRCPLRIPACDDAVPPLDEIALRHAVRCIRASETYDPKKSDRVRQRTLRGDGVLEVSDLVARYGRGDGHTALDGVSLEVRKGECLAVVGESGSGKTTLARCIAGLHAPSAGVITFLGQVLATHARKRSVEQRRAIQIVFQNPDESLNPHQTIRDIVARPAQQLRGMSRREARAAAEEMFELVRLPAGVQRRYPAELSGGERQRVSIARALAADPKLLVCDEVTSALDVSVQAILLDLLADLQRRLGLAMLFVTHDLSVVAATADRVVVLEAGVLRESGAVESILAAPQHPYTQALIRAAPDPGDLRPPVTTVAT